MQRDFVSLSTDLMVPSADSIKQVLLYVQCGKPMVWPSKCKATFIKRSLNKSLLGVLNLKVDITQALPGQEPSPITPQSYISFLVVENIFCGDANYFIVPGVGIEVG